MLVMLVLIRELVEKEPRFGELNEYICVVTLITHIFLKSVLTLFHYCGIWMKLVLIKMTALVLVFCLLEGKKQN